MGDNSAIEWTDATWNPIRGCTQISPGCANCYAKHQAARIVRMAKGKPSKYDGLVRIIPHSGEPAWTGELSHDENTLRMPMRWQRPRRIFVNSMSDLFHEDLPDDPIDAVFAVMILANHHTYQVLTKRADRMRRYITAPGRHEAWSKHIRRLSPHSHIGGVTDEWFARHARHIWLGVSVEDRKHGLPRLRELQGTPGAGVHFLSCEPLLEDLGELDLTGIGWVIDGCESSQGGETPRTAADAWFESIAEQCRAAGVPYFHKQSFVGGKLCHELEDFPPSLRSQEFPR
jgi:protein gp37